MTVRNCAKWSVIVTIGSLLFVGILLGSYGIYRSWMYKSWNDNAVPTYATINSIDITNKTCEYNCKCFGYACKKCEGQCYDAYLNISYGKHHHRYNIFADATNYTLLLVELDDCCIVGHTIRLYYNRDNPHDVSIELHSMLVFWIVIMFTLVITVVCATYVILIYRRETAAFDYQSLYNEPFLEAYNDMRHEYPETRVVLNY